MNTFCRAYRVHTNLTNAKNVVVTISPKVTSHTFYFCSFVNIEASLIICLKHLLSKYQRLSQLWNISTRIKIKLSCILWWLVLSESNQCPISERDPLRTHTYMILGCEVLRLLAWLWFWFCHKDLDYKWDYSFWMNINGISYDSNDK